MLRLSSLIPSPDAVRTEPSTLAGRDDCLLQELFGFDHRGASPVAERAGPAANPVICRAYHV